MSQQTPLTLVIAKVNEQLFNGAAQSVTVPGSEGQMTLLSHHEPIVSLLKKGTIVVRTEGGEKKFDIVQGVLEVSNNQVTILVS